MCRQGMWPTASATRDDMPPPTRRSTGGSNYATAGIHRFDRVTVNVTAVPKPESCALIPAGHHRPAGHQGVRPVTGAPALA